MNSSDFFILNNANKLPSEHLPMIKEKLANKEDNANLAFLTFKDPIITVIFALLLGFCGADQFYLGNIAKGTIKLLGYVFAIILYFIGILLIGLEGGVISIAVLLLSILLFLILGIIILVDIFTALKKTRNKNFENLMLYLN